MNILCLGSPVFAGTWKEAGHRLCVVADSGRLAGPAGRVVDFFGRPRECAAQVRSVIDEFKPDLIFQGDHSTPLIHCGLETVDIPKAWYAIDTHLHAAWHCHYAALFDQVFCAQQNLVAPLRRNQPAAAWLPLFCRRPADFMPWHERAHDVSFVGRIDRAANPGRVALFEALRAAGISLFTATGDFMPVYRSSRIVVNQAVADDLNLRFFEAPGCGSLLVTDRLSHSMNGILEEGDDFLSYESGNAAECAEKIRWAIGNPAEAGAMARRGHEKILASHCEKHRAGEALAAISGRLEKKAPERDPATVAAHCAWTHDYCSRLAIPAPLAAFFSEEAERLAGAGRGSLAGRPLSTLVLAGRALAAGNSMLATSLLAQIAGLPEDYEVRMRYYELKIETAILSGDLGGACASLEAALREFPEDTALKKIEKLLQRTK